ncbi:AEL_HP2_G0029260.mRNA.1.CDS.1 [Saccharomyces cerevisiae]|nr:AEL_HP2_G0029260.mRNA.1.CDS.1 [Saccharomyces cerevisiae]CAI6560977.1 AEL_HP2_G0029260.mRNA.1.CDS.1 [Saccharomyces cerevisiae]CAI6607386.1 AEL_HP1_G0031270.mRNA.1.CDS.1 [Saccharomyces cerevisiae]
MELNNPSIISSSQFSGELSDSDTAAATHKSQQAISNLFQKLAKKGREEKPIGSVESSTDSSNISVATSGNNKESNKKKNKKTAMLNFSSLTDPITNYKPMDLQYKTYAYSMNELYHLKPSLASASYEEDPLISELVRSLPKRKFWRLRMGPPDQKHANNHHFNGNNGGGSWKAGYKNGKNDERRMSRTKNMQGGKRRSQQDDEEKKIDQEMLEMDKNLQLGGDVGHSIADFEDWKAKMKELELKKLSKSKGISNSTAIAPRESASHETPTDLRPVIPRGLSSITDFLNLKRQDKKEESSQQTPGIPVGQPSLSKTSIEQVNELETNSDLGKSSSSRFSSFFNKSATSLPSLDNNNQVPSSNVSVVNNDGNSTPHQSGSRLMSFFKESRSSTPNAESQLLSASDKDNGKMQTLPQFQQQPQQMQPMAFTQHPPNNNAFFNGLLNKGKSETSTPPPPPPGLIAHQGPQFPVMGVPPNFPQRMMPPPPGLVQFQKDSKDVNKKEDRQLRQNKNPNGTRNSKGKQEETATPDLPQQQYMPPPPPPGFFPMHPNFPNGPMPPLPQGFPIPPNGMLPVTGQQPQPPYPNMMLQGNFPPNFQQGFGSNSPMPIPSIINANGKNVTNQLPPGLNSKKNIK